VFPIGGQRFRCYFIHHKAAAPRRLSGSQHLPDFVAAYAETGSDCLREAEALGPLAEFDGADTWVDHPYDNGIVLVGDSAAASDPSFGSGMALTLRDVRVLRDALLADDDWERAAGSYAAEHDRYSAAMRRIEDWMTELLYTPGAEAAARRGQVLPKMRQDREHAPDVVGLGPDGPNEYAQFSVLG
jgi:2-polyprenyl-6-methoxyphenol hydroxylase-like FAD-dependent oxidoreductase